MAKAINEELIFAKQVVSMSQISNHTKLIT